MKNLFIILFLTFIVAAVVPIKDSVAETVKKSASAKVSSTSVMSSSGEMGIIKMFTSASLIVQLTMLLLLFLSIVSWSIILSKWKLFKNHETANIPFEDIFCKAHSLDEIHLLAKSNPHSTLASIFSSGYSEFKEIEKLVKSDKKITSLLPDIDNLQRALNKAVNNEIAFMEKRLSFLATTGTISPFIGLFGTVFGLLNSFQKIGAMGSANLAIVAPGISEALIATAMGLLVAIPAAFFYNSFINNLKKVELTFDNFTTDFLNTFKRNFIE